MKAHTLLILAVVAVAVSAYSIAAIQEKMAVADQGLIGAPFQVLVLLPGDKTQTLAAQVKTQLTIQGESHTLDITSTFVEEFLAQGGSVQELDFVLRDGQTQLLAKGRNLEFVTRSMTDVIVKSHAVPFRLQKKQKRRSHPQAQERRTLPLPKWCSDFLRNIN